jgi:hypothetical protein
MALHANRNLLANFTPAIDFTTEIFRRLARGDAQPPRLWTSTEFNDKIQKLKDLTVALRAAMNVGANGGA